MWEVLQTWVFCAVPEEYIEKYRKRQFRIAIILSVLCIFVLGTIPPAHLYFIQFIIADLVMFNEYKHRLNI